jgi:hypothetical protein
MKLADAPLLVALRDPCVMATFGEAEWDWVVRQAHSAGLLGRLGALAEGRGLKASIPTPVSRHMTAALTVADKQRRAVLWEIKLLSRALAPVGVPVVLLKGAAYAAAGLPPAAGRTFSDIDILVPKSSLPEVEKRLLLSGWISSHHDAYDQRYYRKWMHELPPMTHIRRGTNLDVHHGILPETARIKTRPDLILAAAQPLPGYNNILIPCREDQVLHSATHLYHEGEWRHGLRDLSDLDCLLRAYMGNADFLPRLSSRARQLNLTVPLGHALSNVQILLGTPIHPQPKLSPNALYARLGRTIMDTLFISAMGSAHPSLRHADTPLSEFLLYIRSHWLRMPLHLLIPHLLRKAVAKTEQETPMAKPKSL